MPREFKPLRFFALMAVAVFAVCGVTAFYTHRAAYGRTAEERGHLLDWRKSERASAARREFAERCGIEHAGPETF